MGDPCCNTASALDSTHLIRRSLENCGASLALTPLTSVGVIGIGGLGHLTIQFAAKIRCPVVVFSGTEDKCEEAMKVGASEFYATKGKDVKHIVDFLLVTTSYIPSWKMYVEIMMKEGTVVPLTVAQGYDRSVRILPSERIEDCR